ncbi:MAG TPA: hypothetical protein VJL10_03155, partial [Anaerolineales bacterium]|nr:hypothetical protein [Anaerolineales bacterium]
RVGTKNVPTLRLLGGLARATVVLHSPYMQITFVKKIKADGTACKKCADVEGRLRDGGYMNRINRVVIAYENDPQSEGMQLAAHHQVAVAPFFIVEEEGKAPKIYTIYFRFLKEVLNS